MAIGVITDMATPALANMGLNLKRNFLQPTIEGDLLLALGLVNLELAVT